MKGKIAASGNIMTLLSDTDVPQEIPSNYCFYGLFKECASLISAPQLPATTLKDYCYSHMFDGCENLTKAPQLPAKILAQYCYENMFSGCSVLVKAPNLLAEELVEGCYNHMFENCSNLNYIKAVFITQPGTSYTNSWVAGITGSGIFYKNSAATWNVSGENGVPKDWYIETVDVTSYLCFTCESEDASIIFNQATVIEGKL